MLTLDGDFQMVYYRSDVFADAGIAAPETWQDYVAAAEATHGQDMNGDGTPDYGSCISKKRSAQAYWMILSIAGRLPAVAGEPRRGIFFDTETMAPLVNNEAFAAALDIYTATTAFGPPDEINLDVGDTRSLFTSGRCALTIDWGDIGTLAIDPETSQVIDKVGSIMLPRLDVGARPRHGRARPLRCRDLPPRHQRGQPGALRRLRRLVPAASTPMPTTR